MELDSPTFKKAVEQMLASLDEIVNQVEGASWRERRAKVIAIAAQNGGSDLDEFLNWFGGDITAGVEDETKEQGQS